MTSSADSWNLLGPEGQTAVRAVLGQAFPADQARTFAKAGVDVKPTTDRSGGLPTFVLPAAFEKFVRSLPGEEAK